MTKCQNCHSRESGNQIQMRWFGFFTLLLMTTLKIHPMTGSHRMNNQRDGGQAVVHPGSTPLLRENLKVKSLYFFQNLQKKKLN